MKNKPITNKKIKDLWKPHKKIMGYSRNKVLNFNSSLNEFVRITENPKGYLNKCLGLEVFK